VSGLDDIRQRLTPHVDDNGHWHCPFCLEGYPDEPTSATRYLADVERLLAIAQAAAVVAAAEAYGDLCEPDLNDLRDALAALEEPNP
jgi:histidinol-phosphate/aromatic aminotransferase/cobyric acid decarboxylase-like protein